ncbi:MAG: efflux RND transporter periplasmic adaptor subunit [Chitinophagaceae bacterium]
MQKIIRMAPVAVLLVLLSACGSSSKDEKGSLGDKKAKLEELKGQQKKLADQVSSLEDEIAKLDTSAAKNEKTKLVALTTLGPDEFTHYIDLQGTIDAENIAYVSPKGMGGQVTAIYVKQGDKVAKGKLLMKLNDANERNQVEQANIGVAHAKDLYQRRQSLWSQNIGTEVELINAKNALDQAEKQLSLAQEQLGYTNVYAPMSGVAEAVNIRVGESFSAQSATTFGIVIVNSGDLKIKVNVPENYLDRVGVGSTLLVTLPEANNKTITAKVTVAGKIIDPSTRSFYVEAKIPADKDFRPNQIALVKIQDYAAKDVITIPVNTVQNDEKGKYVLVAAMEKDKMIARKKSIIIGELYGSELEVKGGLQNGDKLITEGFQGLYDGQTITTDTK